MEYDNDYVLCECDLDPLQSLVTALEGRHSITIVRAPSVCLTMVRAEDTLDKQEFYLGEALTTDCEVAVDGAAGYGVCLGEEPARGYCLAVIDALAQSSSGLAADVEEFLEGQRAELMRRDAEEFNLVLRTQVDFKLMEQQ